MSSLAICSRVVISPHTVFPAGPYVSNGTNIVTGNTIRVCTCVSRENEMEPMEIRVDEKWSAVNNTSVSLTVNVLLFFFLFNFGERRKYTNNFLFFINISIVFRVHGGFAGVPFP